MRYYCGSKVYWAVTVGTIVTVTALHPEIMVVSYGKGLRVIAGDMFEEVIGGVLLDYVNCNLSHAGAIDDSTFRR